MTYEEKLDLILKAIIEAQKATINGQSTKLYIKADNGLEAIGKDEVRDILLKLQLEDNVLKINDMYNRLLSIGEQPKNLNYILLDINRSFDSWYESRLMSKKTDLENIDFINMIRIYDVVLDINEQIQLTNKTDIYIHLIPSIIRFQALFPADTIGLRDQYCENRLSSLKYLKNKGVIDNYSYGSSGWSWDSNVEISLRLSAFDDFYKTIQSEYIKRNRVNKDEKEIQIKREKITENKTIWPQDFKWEGKDFVFGQYGSIDFSSDDRKLIFKTLTDKKGGWATMSEMKGMKDANYIRSTIKQIKDRLPEEVKKHLSIISTKDEDNTEKPKVGAYRIRLNS